MSTRTITTEADLRLLLAFLQKKKRPFAVDIIDGRRRSVEQNKLQRLWCREISEQLGDRTAEEVRGEMKLQFGVPILRSEDEEFCREYDAMVKPLPYRMKVRLMMEPFDVAVTRRMTVDQKSRYLDAVFRHYSEQGVVLTIPPDKHGVQQQEVA